MSSVLSYIQTPTSHITNARVFKVNLANIKTAQEIIVISNSGRNVPADMQQPPPPPLYPILKVTKHSYKETLSKVFR